ncbi:hypothetical protein OG851_42640 (plasmid) [Streptomyces sp. NBC_00161]|uniref:hypothetical protein n=1 Tax=Streptomyces sp. NBC_00161 TaxID=2975671 RepID=UPI002F90CACC
MPVPHRAAAPGSLWKKKYGFAGYSVLSEEAKEAYAEQIVALDAAMHATRAPDFRIPSTRGGGGKGKTTSDTDTAADSDAGEEGAEPSGKKEKEDRNYVKATCQCTPAAVIRVSPKTLARRSIMCGECMSDFTVAESAE